MSERYGGDMPERTKKFASHQIIRYGDRLTALSFSVDKGAAVENKWIGHGNPMIVRTAGQEGVPDDIEFAGYARGVMMNVVIGPHGEYLTVHEDAPLTIGEPWVVQGYDESGKEVTLVTGPVEGVLVQYKIVIDDETFPTTNHTVEAPSPFRSLQKEILRAEERLLINRHY